MTGVKEKWLIVSVWALVLWPEASHAIQLHASSEGIITHQIGHLFFLCSMVVLFFIISDKGLDSLRGWRLIQWSAFFFILWNACTVLAHFLDNQIHAVSMVQLSNGQTRIVAREGSQVLAWVYYWLKMDHLLCVPAMVFLYKGLACLVAEQGKKGQP